jgi:hypothetical protein
MSLGTTERELRVGEVVEVRSADEILRTLDSRGELDSMPFMPEMLRYCGRQFKVAKRAHKVCDTISGTGLNRLESTVLLDDLRCNGSAHGGCQAGCLIFWKEAWLKGADAKAAATPSKPSTLVSHPQERGSADINGASTEEVLFAATKAPTNEAATDEEVYSCQATELQRATLGAIPVWKPDQYATDIRSRNVGFIEFVRGFFRSAFFPSRFGHPLLRGKLDRGPSATLDLQPGELVRVKSRKEIVKTLDTENKNRGLNFDVHMLRYCGQIARVLRRVNKIIDERSGKMIDIKSDCIVLEGVVCVGDYRRFCPRRIYPYWRETWLERVTEPGAETGPSGQ